MAIIETSRPVPFGAVSTFRIVNVFDALLSGIASAYSTYKTEKALRGLSADQLQDIGIERTDIPMVAQRAAQV